MTRIQNAWYNIGIAYSKLGRFEEAANAYEYAVAIQDDFASAYFNLEMPT
jgi:tetratricopeptide (TPR) repeat protein